jgi:hypothetical protein
MAYSGISVYIPCIVDRRIDHLVFGGCSSEKMIDCAPFQTGFVAEERSGRAYQVLPQALGSKREDQTIILFSGKRSAG